MGKRSRQRERQDPHAPVPSAEEFPVAIGDGDGLPGPDPPGEPEPRPGVAPDALDSAADPPVADEREPGPHGIPPDPMYADQLVDDVARLNVLYHFYRDAAMLARPPLAEDWYASRERPRIAEVEALFGSWEDLHVAAGIEDSAVVALGRAEQARAEAWEEREREQRRRQQGLERDAQRMPELRRQLDRAKQAREEADGALRDARADAALARAEADRAGSEAERQRDRAARADRAAVDAAAGPGGAGDEQPPEWLAEYERLAAEVETLHADRDGLAAQLDGAQRAVEIERDKVQGLARALSDTDVGDGEADAGPGSAEAMTPRTVRAAVEIAARECRALSFAPRARSSADDCPFRRPADILEALRRLDKLAEGYRQPGGLGRSLPQAAADLGLSWRSDVSELARSRNPDLYSFTVQSRRLALGPHLAIGSGSGAQFVARIYFALHEGDDDLPRGIYVGHVGRHLPDTTT